MIFFSTLYRRDAVNGIFWSLDTKFFLKKNTQYSYCMLELQRIELQYDVTCQQTWQALGRHQGEPTSHQHPVMWKYRSHSLLLRKTFPHYICYCIIQAYLVIKISYFWNFNFYFISAFPSPSAVRAQRLKQDTIYTVSIYDVLWVTFFSVSWHRCW